MEWTRIAVVLTGGTIESRFSADHEREGAAGAFDLIGSLNRRRPPAYATSVDLVTYRAAELLSENMVPGDWGLIAETVARAYGDGASGVVVTHGTDTMAFTCAAASLLLARIPIPVVFTGAMRPVNAPASDAPRNFWDAVTACIESRFAGVFLMFDGHGFVGTHIRSMRSGESNFGPLEDRGYVFDWEETPRYRKLVSSEPPMPVRVRSVPDWRYQPTVFDPRVALFRVYPGFNPRLLEVAASSDIDAQAVVLDLYHSGTGCTRADFDGRYSLEKSIAHLERAGIPVFGSGTPRLRTQQYRSTALLENAGMSPLGLMTAETAVVKAMYLLGLGLTAEDLKREMQRDFVGEFGWYKLSEGAIGQKLVKTG